MTAIDDSAHRIEPPDGNVIASGRAHWEPVRPSFQPEPISRLLVMFTVAGRGVYGTSRIQRIASRGDLVIIDCDFPITYTVPAGQPWEFSWLRFNPRQWNIPPVFDQVAPGLHRAHIALEPTRQRVQDAFARITADIRRRDTARALDGLPPVTADHAPRRTDETRRRLLLTTLDEIFLLAIQDPNDTATVDPRIAVALEVMGTDPTRLHTIESLAEAATLSVSHFAHLFTTQVGMAPMRTLRLIRLQHAARLLQCSNDRIGVIATASGFTSIFDFSRQFRRHFKVSPSEYRAGGGADRRAVSAPRTKR